MRYARHLTLRDARLKARHRARRADRQQQAKVSIADASLEPKRISG
jgi:hypothetical protein